MTIPSQPFLRASQEDPVKNVVFFIQSLEGGGAEKVVLTLAREMTRQGHRVHIILLQDKIDYLLDFEVQIHLFPVPGKKGLLRHFHYQDLGRRLKAFLATLEQKAGRLDLIISNLTEADRILSRADVPRSFFCIHSTTSHQKLGAAKGVRLFLRRRKCRKIYDHRNIIAVSDGVGRDLLEKVGVRPSSIRTIYNPFDFVAIKKLAAVPETIPYSDYMVHVATFKEVKRHDVLLRAFAKSGLSCKLVLLGQGGQEEPIKKLVQQLDLEDRVVFAGFKANPYPWIKNAKLLVLSSDYEGFAMVLVEALICGVAVVSTDCPCGPDEILTGALSQGLAPVGDVEALAERMRTLYGTPVPAHPDGLERFEVQHIVEQYLSLC